MDIDVVQIKDLLEGDSEKIYELLESAGFLNIRENGDEFRCQYDECHTNGGVQVKINTLKANCYSLNFFGDIITLIQEKLSMKFIDTLKWICSVLGIDGAEVKRKNIVLPFGGYYKNIKQEVYDFSYNTYSEGILNAYGNIPSMRFLDDGISIDTQLKYNVGYDVITNRITIPWRNANGEIIGIMGRINLNTEDIPDDVAKYFPIIPFSKNNCVFGLYENYKSISEKNICFIGESEKTPLVLDSMNTPIGLGLGGNVVSEYKANLIKSTRPEIIILGMDEGLDEEISIRNAKLLKSNNTYYKNRVGYIIDKNNTYLKNGSKASPYDHGKKTLRLLTKNCTRWV